MTNETFALHADISLVGLHFRNITYRALNARLPSSEDWCDKRLSTVAAIDVYSISISLKVHKSNDTSLVSIMKGQAYEQKIMLKIKESQFKVTE